MRELGRVDVLVQSAGVTSFIAHANLDAVTSDDWQRILGVNLIGAFQMARAVKAPMDAAGAGVIVNVSSVAGIAGVGSSIPYCASKAGMNNLTVTLARALAPKIRVVAVAPGFITGRWLEGGLGAPTSRSRRRWRRRAPLGRVCDPSDVSDAIVSLICGSDLVTGIVAAGRRRNADRGLKRRSQPFAPTFIAALAIAACSRRGVKRIEKAETALPMPGVTLVLPRSSALTALRTTAGLCIIIMRW